MRQRLLLPALAAVAVAVACARAGSVGLPAPVRPGVLSSTDAQSTFRAISGLMEAQGFPVLMADTSFGVLRTDWVEWDAGEMNLEDVADCEIGPDWPASRTRARFAFEVRPRANRSFVTIISHWQMEKHVGFDDSDRGFVDCRSTGAWERAMEETLTQRQVIR
jgi:hypothetical protein